MIQDIAPHTYHNEYKPVTPDGNSIILAYENGKCFFHKKEDDVSISLPRFRELEGNVSDLYENYIYLFSIDQERFYLIPGLDTSLLPGYESMKQESFVMSSHSILLSPQSLDISSGSGTKIGVSADAVENQ